MTSREPDLSPLARLLYENDAALTAAPVPRPSVGDPPAAAPGPAPATGTDGAATGTRRSMRFQPGLEGLRGLAVAGVLVFHGGFTWATGGFLGVSTFFTLSGFLITTLLLLEHDSTGTISLKQFWGRRFRRLMPASLVALAGVVLLFAPFVATPSQLDSLPGDVFSSLAYVANWHFVLTGQSYEQLFSDPSPLLHFWSLAIEEQFYVLFPLVMSVLVARWVLRRKALAFVLGGLAVASTIEMALLYDPADTSRVYYGTDTRAAELLAGAVLAVVLLDRTLSRRLRVAAIAAGSAALVAVLWLWTGTAQTDSWLYRGGLALYALLTCSIIVAATQPGLVRNVLANPVLRWLGRVSYGVYLFHWPIFLWIDQTFDGMNDYVAFIPKIVITFVLAELSLRIIEMPVREKKRLTSWQPFVAAPLAIALIVVATFVVTGGQRDRSKEIAFGGSVSSDGVEMQMSTTTLLREPTPIPPIDPEPPPILPFASGTDLHVILEGDSAIDTLASESPDGLHGWADSTGSMTLTSYSKYGCGIVRGGMQLYAQKVEQVGVAGAQCKTDWAQGYEMDLDGINPDTGAPFPGHVKPQVVVGMFGVWDVLDKQLPGDTEWRHVGDPLYDGYLVRELSKAMDLLASRGAIVIWMTSPVVQTGITEGHPANEQVENDPARMERLNTLVKEIAATRPHVRVIDLAAHMAARPQGALDLTERPDGIHWTRSAATDLAQWVGPQIVQTYEQAWNEITAAQSAATASSTSSTAAPAGG